MFQILVGVSLMVYVVQKARRELQLALMETELSSMTNNPPYYLRDSALPDAKVSSLTNLIV